MALAPRERWAGGRRSPVTCCSFHRLLGQVGAAVTGSASPRRYEAGVGRERGPFPGHGAVSAVVSRQWTEPTERGLCQLCPLSPDLPLVRGATGPAAGRAHRGVR